MTRINYRYGLSVMRALIENKIISSYLIDFDEPVASYSDINDINLEYCEEHNIPTVDLLIPVGGVIVDGIGDLVTFDIRSNKQGDLSYKMMQDFKAFLCERGFNATIDSNDVLIDGYKVASAGMCNLPPDYRMMVTFAHFSLNVDLELIRNICKKPMVKIPKGLTEFGFTTEEIAAWIDNWFRENE